MRARRRHGEEAAEFGARGSGQRGGAAGDPQASAGVVAAHDQRLGSCDRSEDPADDGLGGEPGPDLAPGPATGPVVLVEALGDHPFDARGGVIGEPGASDGRSVVAGMSTSPCGSCRPRRSSSRGKPSNLAS
jgi:hypothetical protein